MNINYFDLVVGFDTEYVSGRNLTSIPDNQNSVVSYQMAFFHPATGAKGSGLLVTSGPEKRLRIRLDTLLSQLIRTLSLQYGIDIHEDFIRAVRGVPPSKQRKIRIAIVAHFSRADLPGFKDFKSLRKSVDAIRGTFASVKWPTVREVRMPSRLRVPVSITLFDTKLLAPEGAGSLRAIGGMLGRPKLTLPDVVGEGGQTVRGIERMDLVLKQHPDEFKAYALRDPEIAVDYFIKVAAFADSWGLKKIPATIAGMAVARFWTDAGSSLPAIIGRGPNSGRKRGEPLPEAQAIQGQAADGYLGGRNEAFAHGIFAATRDRPFRDFDLKGCYTTAMVPFRAIDWARIVNTTDLELLATLDDPAIAKIDFEFPTGTRFPCLPVNTGDGGLVYALSGSTTVTGPELLLARDMGAHIVARAGVVAPWAERDLTKTTLPFLDFSRFIAAERARHKAPKGTPPDIFELLAKEAGNSLYGKTGQGVRVMKSVRESIRVFDSRTGAYGFLPPSSITSPILAANTSGLARAVLSEILSRLPPHVRVLSATTDGWLSDCTPEEALAAKQGPICRYFAKLRAMVDPNGSDEILEEKHAALKVLVARTRHGITIAPVAGSDYILARAGHRLLEDFSDYDASDPDARLKARAAEADAFVQLQRDRTYNTKLTVKSFVSLAGQWKDVSDLVEVTRNVQANLCYDMKRKPVEPSDVDGLINFQTRPWNSLQEALEGRDDLDRWKGAAKAVLKTTDHWTAFQAWRGAKRKQGFARRTPLGSAVLAAWAKGLAGFSIRGGGGGRSTTGVELPPTKIEVAKILTGAGVEGVTPKVLDNARRREPDPTGTVDDLLPGDAELLRQLTQYASVEGLKSLFLDPTGIDWDLRLHSRLLEAGATTKDASDGKSESNLLIASRAFVEPDQAIDEPGENTNFQKPEANLLISPRGEHWNEEVKDPSTTTAETLLETQAATPEVERLEAAVPGPTPATAEEPHRVSSLSDVKHLARIRTMISRRHGVTRAGWTQGVKAAARRAGLSPRERDLLAVVLAVAARLGSSERAAFRLVGDVAAATLEQMAAA